jgi:lysophospholipase
MSTQTTLTATAISSDTTPRTLDNIIPGVSVVSPDQLLRRASAQAPNGYVPTNTTCPATRPSIRKGVTLSDQEVEWLPKRRNATIPHIRKFLKRVNIPAFDSEAFLKNVETDLTALPNIGIAISGGGYRAMLSGAGALAAWDERTHGSQENGHLGGLLQSATYVSGLSGGSWLLGSLVINNWTSVQDAITRPGLWQLENSIFAGPGYDSAVGYFSDVVEAVTGKGDAGFQRSLTDFWGRMLSYQLINTTDGGSNITWSSIADDEAFKLGDFPLPIVIANGRNPNETIVARNSTVFEFTPWELGSFDPTVNGYVPLKYVGSEFTNGKLPMDKSCVRGFDNAGFVMGTSSSLFNQILHYLDDSDNIYMPDNIPDFAIEMAKNILEELGQANNDIADWSPNPFKGWNKDHNPFANNNRLTLVDGGEDLQNIPFYPHMNKDRAVDVILSYDSSADTETFWPDGTSRVATYQRSLDDISNGSSFPVIPGKNTIQNLGLNSRPTFFGCNATIPTPLVVYIPNYPYVYAANISTFKMTIDTPEIFAMVENGYTTTTQLNGTIDSDWTTCIACAILSRSFERTNTTVPEKCQSCFTTYCWNGTVDEREPDSYNPAFLGTAINVDSVGGRLFINVFVTGSIAVIAVALNW